nr:outer membrane beta-barrel protein [Cellvibrionaceae bacterium]
SAPELDKYEDTSVDARYDLGRESTRLRLHLNAEVMAREYTTNPSTTRIRDRSQTQLGGRLSLRMLDRLSSRVQLSSLAIDYDANNDPGGRRDSNETSYTLGFSWQISSQFDIDVDAGKLEREFDSPRRRGFSTSSWDVELNWSPLDRSAFGLLSSRSTEEPSSGNSDVIVRTRTGVSWSHEWSSRLRSSLAYSRGESEYKGSQREDDTDDYSMDVNYQFRRWLGFGLNAQYLEQRSTDVDYDRTQLGLNVLITL